MTTKKKKKKCGYIIFSLPLGTGAAIDQNAAASTFHASVYNCHRMKC